MLSLNTAHTVNKLKNCFTNDLLHEPNNYEQPKAFLTNTLAQLWPDFQTEISSEDEYLSSASVSLAHPEDHSQPSTTDTEHSNPVMPDEPAAKVTKKVTRKVSDKEKQHPSHPTAETKTRKTLLKPEVKKYPKTNVHSRHDNFYYKKCSSTTGQSPQRSNDSSYSILYFLHVSKQ